MHCLYGSISNGSLSNNSEVFVIFVLQTPLAWSAMRPAFDLGRFPPPVCRNLILVKAFRLSGGVCAAGKARAGGGLAFRTAIGACDAARREADRLPMERWAGRRVSRCILCVEVCAHAYYIR